MSTELIGVLAVVVVLILIICRMWIGVAMGIVGFVGLVILRGWSQSIVMVADVPFTNVNSYTMTVLPMFALMGMIISESNIGSDLFKACNAWLGQRRGGLASATVITSAFLGAICGSHMVGTVILSKVALPEMRRYKYEDGFASSTVCAGAPLSIIIPPSLPLIMYGIIAEQNIGKLFMSGFVPGIIMTIVFVTLIVIMCKRNPEIGPRTGKMPLSAKLKASWGIIPVVILFIMVLGGVYTGVFTTTESGAIGSVGAFIIALCYKSLNGKKITLALKETVLTVGMVFSLLLGTYIFIKFITYSQFPAAVSSFLVNLSAPMPVLMLVLAGIYILLGMLLPEIPMIILTVPILFPALMAVGFDPIWLGIYIVLMMALGAITPPIGMVVFIVSGISGVSVPKLFKSCMPFIVADLIVILLICIFPAIATWLPSLM